MKVAIKRAAISAMSLLGEVYQTSGVPIITYHSVDEESLPISTPTEIFARQMSYLKKKRISVIPLSRLCECLVSRNPLPERSAVITFDDAFEGVFKYAFPILREFGYPATVFAVTDYVGKQMDWETVEGVPAYRLSTWDELAEMDAAGIEIESHTMTHRFMTELDEKSIAAEVEGSVEAIEKRLDKKVRFLAYPYGVCNPTAVKVVKQSGILAAVTGTFGITRENHDPYTLKRVGTDWVSLHDHAGLMNTFRACVSGTASIYVWLRNRSPLMVNRLGRERYTKR